MIVQPRFSPEITAKHMTKDTKRHRVDTKTVWKQAVLGTAFSAALAALALPALAEPVPYAPSATGLQVREQGAPVRVQVLNLPKGRSAVIDLPVDAADVFVSDPKVADAVLRTPRRIFVLGVDAGQSDAIFFDAMGRQILNLSIRVDMPTDELADTVHRLFPNTHVEVQSLNGHVVLSGMARDDSEADAISRLAASFTKDPADVINMMSIAGKDQVTLKVRIVEVNRSTIKQLGMATDMTYNFGTRSYGFGQGAAYSTNGGFQGGKGLCYGQAGVATIDGTVSSTDTTTTATGSVQTTLTNSGTKKFGTNTTACLQAFERVGLARTLAEPNLTAVSGEAAKFLAGGEFPVPVGQDTTGRITVEFKPFGVGLGFTPVVMSSGRISLKISTEVSELTNVGALNLGTISVPGLTVRRAETSVEMQSGSSLMIAGLLQSKFRSSIDSLPGLTTLPVLGSLFRSRDFLNDETEMVVIVTPYIVDPADPDQMQTPGDNLEPSSDASAVFLGRLNKVVKAGAPATAAAPGPDAPYSAPVGYVIE